MFLPRLVVQQRPCDDGPASVFRMRLFNNDTGNEVPYWNHVYNHRHLYFTVFGYLFLLMRMLCAVLCFLCWSFEVFIYMCLHTSSHLTLICTYTHIHTYIQRGGGILLHLLWTHTIGKWCQLSPACSGLANVRLCLLLLGSPCSPRRRAIWTSCRRGWFSRLWSLSTSNKEGIHWCIYYTNGVFVGRIRPSGLYLAETVKKWLT